MAIETCIEGAFTGWSGETAFELCNGQVWVQTEYDYVYHYAYRPRARLTQTRGDWQLRVDGLDRAVSVALTEAVKAQIDGEFTGWSGETKFTLTNGQVWKQARYAYHYSYSYRPRILIYRVPSGRHRLGVDGSTESVEVTRVA